YLIATGVTEQVLLPVGQGGGVGGQVKVNPRVHLLHATPDAPTIDVLVNDITIADDLEFAELSQPLTLAPGAATLQIVSSDNEVLVDTLTTEGLEPGQSYLVIIGGRVTPEGHEPDLPASSFPASVPPGSLAIVHALPAAPALHPAHAHD